MINIARFESQGFAVAKTRHKVGAVVLNSVRAIANFVFVQLDHRSKE